LPLTNGNGVKKNFTLLLLVLSVIFILVDKIVMPVVNAGPIAQIREDVARLEECVYSLRPLPAQVAGLSATVKSLEKTLDKIEKSVDTIQREIK
jgi:uncharacterized protein YlxW (UPF0749 family)